MWLSCTDHQPCDECRKTFLSFGKEPPCATCRPQDVTGVSEVLDLYGMVGDQWVLSPMGGKVAMRIEAIESVMRLCQIPTDERKELLGDVLAVGRIIADRQAEKAAKENEGKR